MGVTEKKKLAKKELQKEKLAKKELNEIKKQNKNSEKDRENRFYTADEVYLDEPFRLQDYRTKLESGSVKEAPSCDPYRKLYFLHLNMKAAEKLSSEEKKIARIAFYNLYSTQISMM